MLLPSWTQESLLFANWLQIRFIADPIGEFTKALDLSWDGGVAVFGGPRSQRYALKVEDGKVTKTFIEPDATGANGTFPQRGSSWLRR